MTGRTLSLLCLLLSAGLSTHAGAAPILAEFSRTANSIADDGIGPTPAPLQVVNNVNRTGRVETQLTDGTFASRNVAQGYALVGFGILRVIATTNSQDGLQKTATADGAFQDVLDIVGAGTLGDTYHFSGAFSVTGTTAYTSFTGGLSAINAAYHWNAYQDNIAIGGAAANFTRNSTGLDPEGVDFLGTTIPVAFDFVWGEQIILEMGLGAGAAANSLSAAYATATVDMGHSLIWQGASILALDGSPVDASIQSGSGTDWSKAAAVPEPSTLVLLTLAATIGARRRRRHA